MMATIGTLVMNISANTASFEAGIRRAQGQVDAFSASIKSAFASFVGGSITGAIENFIGSSAESFRQSQDASAKLAAVLAATGNTAGLTAKQMEAYASQLQAVTRYNDEAILNAESLLATFGAVSGETFKRTIRAALDLSSVFGTDLDSSVRLLGRALVAPEEGFARLSRMGVVFTDSQKSMITTLAESGQTIAAQNALLAELEKRVGGVSEAMGKTAAGSIDRMRNAIDDLKEATGALFVGTGAADFVSAAARGITAKFDGKSLETLADFRERRNEILHTLGAEQDASARELQAASDRMRSLAFEISGLTVAGNAAEFTNLQGSLFAFAREFSVEAAGKRGGISDYIRSQVAGISAPTIGDPFQGFERLRSWTAESWKNVEKMAHEMGLAAKHANEMGQRLTESVMTPLEHYQKTLADAQGLLNVGAIDDATFGRVRAKALQELGRGAFPDRGPGVTPLALQGSQDAFRLIDELRNRPLEQNMLKTEEEILAEAKTQSELLQQMVDDAVQLHVVRLN